MESRPQTHYDLRLAMGSCAWLSSKRGSGSGSPRISRRSTGGRADWKIRLSDHMVKFSPALGSRLASVGARRTIDCSSFGSGNLFRPWPACDGAGSKWHVFWILRKPAPGNVCRRTCFPVQPSAGANLIPDCGAELQAALYVAVECNG